MCVFRLYARAKARGKMNTKKLEKESLLTSRACEALVFLAGVRFQIVRLAVRPTGGRRGHERGRWRDVGGGYGVVKAELVVIVGGGGRGSTGPVV